MNRERLEHLIQTLEEVERKDKEQNHRHFDMGQWVILGATNCDTVACAAGWEALTPYAQEHGFKWDRYYNGLSFTGDDDELLYFGTNACAKYFDIDYDLAQMLFMPDWYSPNDEYYVSPRHVIDRVKWLLAANDENPDIDRYDAHHLPGGEKYYLNLVQEVL